MKAIHLSFLFTVISIATSIGQSKWSFDDAHSNLQFSLSHLMVTDVEGSIKVSEASLVAAGDDFANASISVKGDMSSIDTDNDGRDEHLRAPDFFDVAKFPNVTFHSTTFKKISDTKYEVAGLLTLKSVSKQVIFDVTATKNIRPYDNKTIVGFRVNGTINRMDFGISKETPSTMLGEEVQIRGNVIFVIE